MKLPRYPNSHSDTFHDQQPQKLKTQLSKRENWGFPVLQAHYSIDVASRTHRILNKLFFVILFRTTLEEL